MFFVQIVCMGTARKNGGSRMTLAEEKQAQRKAGIAARRALAPETRAAANATLCARLAALPGAWAKRWPIPSAGKISA